MARFRRSGRRRSSGGGGTRGLFRMLFSIKGLIALGLGALLIKVVGGKAEAAVSGIASKINPKANA